MLYAVITLAVLLVLALAWGSWCAIACASHRERADRLEQYNGWLETREAVLARQLAHLRQGREPSL
jgi:hypothetical protein